MIVFTDRCVGPLESVLGSRGTGFGVRCWRTLVAPTRRPSLLVSSPANNSNPLNQKHSFHLKKHGLDFFVGPLSLAVAQIEQWKLPVCALVLRVVDGDMFVWINRCPARATTTCARGPEILTSSRSPTFSTFTAFLFDSLYSSTPFALDEGRPPSGSFRLNNSDSRLAMYLQKLSGHLHSVWKSAERVGRLCRIPAVAGRLHKHLLPHSGETIDHQDSSMKLSSKGIRRLD
ncbi:Hypothetical predicted protein [Olea europaea subsp. europaea]|uniref:Uncharacterized protein n=1 Tax=Olea europaea subsp. europaea TaxID=158383 RepID=A0A8S0Q7F7_OLEEU|nr:Hypothetical predicted protein [Olea europaea subsp. europaea]